MKIIITESQLGRLKILKEQQDDIDKYRAFCQIKAEEVNNIYNKVSYETLANFLNMSVDVEQLIKHLEMIETAVEKAERNMLQLWERGIVGDGDDSYDMIINEIAHMVTDKTTSLTLILGHIEEIQIYQKKHNLTRYFDDNKPLDIEGLTH